MTSRGATGPYIESIARLDGPRRAIGNTRTVGDNTNFEPSKNRGEQVAVAVSAAGVMGNSVIAPT